MFKKIGGRRGESGGSGESVHFLLFLSNHPRRKIQSCLKKLGSILFSPPPITLTGNKKLQRLKSKLEKFYQESGKKN